MGGVVSGYVANDNRVIAGSGVYSDGSSCGSCVSLKLLEWKDCDTVGKVIGFVLGRTLNFIVFDGGRCLHHVVQLLYLDKVSNYFFRFICSAYNFCADIADRIYVSIKPIFVNQITRSLVTWNYDFIITPIGRAIKCVGKFFFETFLWNKDH